MGKFTILMLYKLKICCNNRHNFTNFPKIVNFRTQPHVPRIIGRSRAMVCIIAKIHIHLNLLIKTQFCKESSSIYLNVKVCSFDVTATGVQFE